MDQDFQDGNPYDSQGRSRAWSEADLDRIVAGYDPASREAPLVFGHPKDNHPAFGWVEALRRSGEFLEAKFKQVHEAVKAAVEAGLYKKVSIAVRPDFSLRHVGLLGAVTPAIPGLGDVRFGDGEATFYEFEEAHMDVEELKRQLEAARAEIAKLKAGDEFAEERKAKDAEIEDLKTKLKTAQDGKAKAEQDFAEFKAGQAKQARETRVDALIAEGKLMPTERANSLAFAEALAASPGEMEFSAGEGKAVEKVSKEEAYWRGLEARDPHGLFGEFKAPSGGPKDQPLPGNLAGKF